ncbi:hypothetical protein [Leisingera sp. ANG-Vp]|uniref:hypothetical protein n=1 Tax=Leisingera sp. ANG-Vp TaxID=1577896 RepID=UPI00187BC999|nr:hypothetical protein [Leisingera sp. ANG-Vp]
MTETKDKTWMYFGSVPPFSVHPALNGPARFKLKTPMTWRGTAFFNVLVALQDGFNPRIMTAGAKVVDWLYALSRAVDNGPAGGIPKFVACKLFLAAFKLDHLVAKISYRLTKRYIRLARTHYLFSQASDGFSDLFHWRRLRRLKQRLESINGSYRRIERRGPLLCDVYCLLRGVYVEIHQVAVLSKENSKFRQQDAAAKAGRQGEVPGCSGAKKHRAEGTRHE